MYVITEWFERYEVNDKGQPARAGDKLRKGSLDYVRSKVHGRSQGAGFAAMQCLAGLRAYEVFGLFQKFLEIQGAENADLRQGPLLNARGQPATCDDLAFICRFPRKRVAFALQVLCHPDVRWMQNSQPDPTFQEFQEFQEKKGIPGLARARGNTTQHNTTQHKEEEVKEEERTTTAPSVEMKSHFSSDAEIIISAWQKLPLPTDLKKTSLPVIQRVEQLLSELAQDPVAPVHLGMILEGISNYDKALRLPDSQTYKHPIQRFLGQHLRRTYLEGVFNIENHKARNFQRGRHQNTHDQLAQLKAEGRI